MSARFEQFRLSLMPRKQRDAFAGPDPTREEYLRDVLGKEWRFKHYGNELRYLPKEMGDGSVLFADVGREGLIREKKPPEEGFADDSHMGWLTSAVVIDPTDHRDGQRVAFQHDKTVGAPGALIESLVSHINLENPNTAYSIEVEPIINTTQFWEFVAESKSPVTSVTFELVAPNGIFSTGTDTTDEMRRFREVMGARKVTTTFQNQDGLDIHAKPFEDGVEYAARAGGKIRAKKKDGKKFNSTNKPSSTTLPDEEEAETNENILVKAARYLTEVFGR